MIVLSGSPLTSLLCAAGVVIFLALAFLGIIGLGWLLSRLGGWDSWND